MARLPHVCILTSQYFDGGIYGGFGSMSRKLAEGLAHAGHEVSVIVPRRNAQASQESIKGVTVLRFSPMDVSEARRILRASAADIFHSQDPTVLTYLAQRLHPNRIHLVTCRDPRDARDWWVEFRHATWKRRLRTPFHYFTESGLLAKAAVRAAHAVYCPAHFLRPKIKRLYGLATEPTFLPNLIDVPPTVPPKSATPTLVFVARWEGRKRPHLFLGLAAQFPQYRFVAVGNGGSSAEAGYDAALRKRFGSVPNLEMPGFVDRFKEPERMRQILSDAWVLVCTAAREGLPLTFLEASAHGCAILSSEDPDQFATRFGRQVRDDDFASGVREILADSPLERGKAGHAYVRDTYECEQALAAHRHEYGTWFGGKS